MQDDHLAILLREDPIDVVQISEGVESVFPLIPPEVVVGPFDWDEVALGT